MTQYTTLHEEGEIEAKKRERYYWNVCVFFILLSPILIYHGLNHEMGSGFDPFYYAVSMIAGLIAVIPFETIPVILRGEKVNLKIGARHPKYEFTTASSMEFDNAVKEIEHRLKSMGFSVNEMKESDSLTVLRFGKEKPVMVHSFMDNAIQGSVRIEKKFTKPDIAVEVIYQDILLIDSGESEAMNALARYISLYTERFVQYNINMTLTAGTLVSFISNILLFLHYFGIKRFAPSLLISVSLGAIGLVAFGLFFTFRDRKHLIGARFGIAAVYLALLTFIPVVKSLPGSVSNLTNF
ncbi:MAG: hypothetical protein JSV88_17635 [Candidatus Aminicenantes bacterium]|nr:MAG: hypothetical protein JSV88_17635 [Candidatus Aminicenantes bacterium]